MRGLQYFFLIVFGFLGALGLSMAVMKNEFGAGSSTVGAHNTTTIVQGKSSGLP